MASAAEGVGPGKRGRGVLRPAAEEEEEAAAAAAADEDDPIAAAAAAGGIDALVSGARDQRSSVQMLTGSEQCVMRGQSGLLA